MRDQWVREMTDTTRMKAGLLEGTQMALAEILEIATLEDRPVHRLREIRAIAFAVKLDHYTAAGLEEFV